MKGILRGLRSRTLTCGCVVGVYEKYDSRVVAILDVRGIKCENPRHTPNAEIDMGESSGNPSGSDAGHDE